MSGIMSEPRINGLRSIELGVHDLQKSAEFYRRGTSRARAIRCICAAPAATTTS